MIASAPAARIASASRRPAGAGERRAAQRLDQLDRGEPDSAAGSGHEHRLARPEPAAVEQREMRGLVDQAHGRGLGEAHRLGQDVGVLVRGQDLLGIGALLDLDQDPVADPAMARALAHRGDHAGRRLARHERQRGRI